MPTDPKDDAEVYERYGHRIQYDKPIHKEAFRLKCTTGLTLKLISKRIGLSEKAIRMAVKKCGARVVAYHKLFGNPSS